MRSWLKWRSDRVILPVILLLFLSHLPFLSADPDSNISFSRGPFTDEGLNTIQVRNLINHGYLSLEECDNLLKTPLFGTLVGLPMSVFGTRLWISRLTVLVFLTLTLLLLSRSGVFSRLLLLAVPVLFFKYQVFHFSHFSLAEASAIAAILAGIYFLYRAYTPFRSEKQYIRNTLLAGALLSLAWYFKIQFIYILALGPLVAVERAFFARKLSPRIRWLNGLILSGTTVMFLLAYLLAWYLPNKEIYDHMMAYQSGTFSLGPKTWEYIRFNTTHYMLTEVNRVFSATFLVSLALGIFFLTRKSSSHFPVLFSATLIWFLLEFHKLTMVYLPTRYQVSLFAAMGMLIAVVLLELFQGESLSRTGPWKPAMRSAVAIWVSVFFFLNMLDYAAALENRTYSLREANRYLASTLEKEDKAIGAWAPSLTWDAGCISFPVWGGFLNDEEPIERFRPTAVISEPDEQDSEQAYKKQGIDLAAVSDSVKTFRIGSWKVSVFWIGSAEAGTLTGL